MKHRARQQDGPLSPNLRVAPERPFRQFVRDLRNRPTALFHHIFPIIRRDLPLLDMSSNLALPDMLRKALLMSHPGGALCRMTGDREIQALP